MRRRSGNWTFQLPETMCLDEGYDQWCAASLPQFDCTTVETSTAVHSSFRISTDSPAKLSEAIYTIAYSFLYSRQKPTLWSSRLSSPLSLSTTEDATLEKEVASSLNVVTERESSTKNETTKVEVEYSTEIPAPTTKDIQGQISTLTTVRPEETTPLTSSSTGEAYAEKVRLSMQTMRGLATNAGETIFSCPKKTKAYDHTGKRRFCFKWITPTCDLLDLK